MKRSILILSLLLNVPLLALYFAQGPKNHSHETPAKPRTQVLTKTIVQEVSAPVETNLVEEAPTDFFQWSSIQSTNFVDYAEKLQAIGCPDQTIRDIITGEVNDWMLAQRRMLIAPYAPRFWEFAANGAHIVPKELKEPLRQLKKTRDDMIAQALKKVPQTESVPAKRGPRKDETLAMLSEEKLRQINDINKKYDALRKEIDQNKELNHTQKNERKQALIPKIEAEKQGVMSPEELAEYKVRRESYRFQNLYGFETNPEEMRKIAEVYAKNSAWSNDPDFNPAVMEERSRQRDEQIKALIGEQRFAEFKRGSDSSFREVWQVAQAYKLPQEAAAKAYEIQTASTEQFTAIQNDTSLSNDEKRAATEALQDRVEDATVAILGEKATASYRKITRSKF